MKKLKFFLGILGGVLTVVSFLMLAYYQYILVETAFGKALSSILFTISIVGWAYYAKKNHESKEDRDERLFKSDNLNKLNSFLKRG